MVFLLVCYTIYGYIPIHLSHDVSLYASFTIEDTILIVSNKRIRRIAKRLFFLQHIC